LGRHNPSKLPLGLDVNNTSHSVYQSLDNRYDTTSPSA